jgi:hypothetical protein
MNATPVAVTAIELLHKESIIMCDKMKTCRGTAAGRQCWCLVYEALEDKAVSP